MIIFLLAGDFLFSFRFSFFLKSFSTFLTKKKKKIKKKKKKKKKLRIKKKEKKKEFAAAPVSIISATRWTGNKLFLRLDSCL